MPPSIDDLIGEGPISPGTKFILSRQGAESLNHLRELGTPANFQEGEKLVYWGTERERDDPSQDLVYLEPELRVKGYEGSSIPRTSDIFKEAVVPSGPSIERKG